jgi:small nuclear ribonucleoprotein (snRNP)-like protein
VTFALLVLAASVFLAACVVAFAGHPRVLAARAKRTVLVTLKSGASFRGVLTSSDRDLLVLKGAEALDGAVPVDGELLLFRGDVDYIQAP